MLLAFEIFCLCIELVCLYKTIKRKDKLKYILSISCCCLLQLLLILLEVLKWKN